MTRRLARLLARLGLRNLAEPRTRPPTVDDVERVAFRMLFASRQPLPMAQLATDLGVPTETVEPLVAEIEGHGELIRGNEGKIIGIAGLSLAPTRHVLVANGVARWTWCAWDALSIGALLGKGVVVRSLCPQTGAAIEVKFTRRRIVSRPRSSVLLITERSRACRTVDDWCPMINLLANHAAANAWIDSSGIAAEIVPVDVAARRGARQYRRLVHPVPTSRPA